MGGNSGGGRGEGERLIKLNGYHNYRSIASQLIPIFFNTGTPNACCYVSKSEVIKRSCHIIAHT